MALTHVFDPVKYTSQQVDLSDMKVQLDTALALLDNIINDATVTNAEAVTYLKQVAIIQKKSLKALARIVVA